VGGKPILRKIVYPTLDIVTCGKADLGDRKAANRYISPQSKIRGLLSARSMKVPSRMKFIAVVVANIVPRTAPRTRDALLTDWTHEIWQSRS